MTPYRITTMTRREFGLAVDWAAAEGWNPGLHDAKCFYATDPSGFLMGLVEDEPVAVLSAVKYGETFGFLGFYIVKPAFRGRGYGLRIWQAGLDCLKGRNIGLDGVVEQQDNYVRSGFKLAHRNVRYEGKGELVSLPVFLPVSLPISMSVVSDNIVPLSSIPIEKVIEYDRCFFPGDRATFLKAWLVQPDSSAVGYMHSQALAGYGVIRACRNGYKIGPLFADSAQVAEDILVALKSSVEPGSAFYLDVPEVNFQAVALAERHGMKRVFETARMYTQQAPNLPLDRIFGVTTLELG